jgi:hypothetical protein
MLNWQSLRPAAAGGLLLLAGSLGAAAEAQTQGSVRGVVFDSLRGRVLTSAILRLEPSNREAFSDSTGAYQFRGVPAGSYIVRALHPALDTLGISVVTPRFTVDSTPREINVAVPPRGALLRQLCPAGQLARGPSAVVGFIRDLDTDRPVANVRVSLLVLVQRDSLGFMRDTIVRETTADAGGKYRICGLPARFDGDLAITQSGTMLTATPVQSQQPELVTRAMGLSFTTPATTGTARLRGTVLDSRGQPLGNVAVSVLGNPATARTNALGVFSLDSLPAGTQTLELRRIGYDVTERSVNLLNGATEDLRLTMNTAATLLPGVTAVDRRAAALEKVGYMRRKANATGGFF